MTDENYSENAPKPEDQEQSEPDQGEIEMDTNQGDTDIYEDKGSEKLEEDGVITNEDEGFMKGAAKDGEDANCRQCGKVLVNDLVEKEINSEVMRFCCDECLNKYEEEHKGEEES